MSELQPLESLSDELDRLVREHDEGVGDAAEAWNLIADWAVENCATICSALRSREGQVEGWQPMETAPMDGTAVWVVVDGRPYIGYFDPDDAPWAKPQWFIKATYSRRDLSSNRTDEIIGCYGFDVSPTHWMSLPAPPSPEGTGR